MKMLIFILGISVCSVFSLQEYFISTKDAKAKWGIQSFSPEKFKSFKSEPMKRAPMAVELLATQNLKGRKMADIIKMLGAQDGYFFSDAILAYKIQIPNEKSKESWQLLFIPDEALLNVKEIKIHRRCCDK